MNQINKVLIPVFTAMIIVFIPGILIVDSGWASDNTLLFIGVVIALAILDYLISVPLTKWLTEEDITE